MAPPQVRDIQALIAEQQASLKPQYDLIDQSITANDTAGGAQVAGIGAAKDQAFQDITQGAQNKGMMFSGFTPDEQAKYTASTYLPQLAQLQATIASTRSNLLGKKADLGKSAFDTAVGLRENDMQFLNNWNKMTAEQQFSASEADKQRAFTAAQQASEQKFTANQNAANRSASAPKDISGIVNTVGKFLSGRTGSDGKVSPVSFQEGRQQWVAAGGSPDAYNQAFAGYINTDHYWNYYGSK